MRRTRAKNATTRPGQILAPVPRRSSAQVAAEKSAAAEKKAAASVRQKKKISALSAKEQEIEKDNETSEIPHRRQPRPVRKINASEAQIGDGTFWWLLPNLNGTNVICRLCGQGWKRWQSSRK